MKKSIKRLKIINQGELSLDNFVEVSFDKFVKKQMEMVTEDIINPQELTRLSSLLEKGTTYNLTQLHAHLTSLLNNPIPTEPSQWADDLIKALERFGAEIDKDEFRTLLIKFHGQVLEDAKKGKFIPMLGHRKIKQWSEDIDREEIKTWCSSYIDGTCLYKKFFDYMNNSQTEEGEFFNWAMTSIFILSHEGQEVKAAKDPYTEGRIALLPEVLKQLFDISSQYDVIFPDKEPAKNCIKEDDIKLSLNSQRHNSLEKDCNMKKVPKGPLSSSELKLLTNLLKKSAEPSLAKLHGFLTSICSSPVDISMSTWFPGLVRPLEKKGLEANLDQLSVLVFKLLNEVQNDLKQKKLTPILSNERIDNWPEGIDKGELGTWCSAYIGGTVLYDKYWNQATQKEGPHREFFRIANTLLATLSGKAAELFSLTPAMPPEIQQKAIKDLPDLVNDLYKCWQTFREEIASDEKTSLDPQVDKNIGRNDLCPCKSGKKFKKCCLNAIEKEFDEPVQTVAL